jgi:hypothetical protein
MVRKRGKNLNPSQHGFGGASRPGLKRATKKTEATG